MLPTLRQITPLRLWRALKSAAARVRVPAAAGAAGVAGQLLQSADAMAGHDPHQAQGLRLAACAYLSVVR